MSTASQLEALESRPADLAGAPARAAVGDPLVFGLPLIAVGAFALGLQLVGLSTSAQTAARSRC